MHRQVVLAAPTLSVRQARCICKNLVALIPTPSSALFSTQDNDKSLGKLSVPLRDIVRNGFMKDTWTLQDAEKGQVRKERGICGG